MKGRPSVVAGCIVSALAVSGLALALDIESFEKKLTVTTLDNGLTIMIYERTTAPVVSFA